MGAFKEKKFDDRLSAAEEARRAMLERFKARPGRDHPDVIKRQEEQRAVAEAREKRASERAAAKKADEERRAAEEAARIAAEEERRRVEAEERLRKEMELEVERKAARDARYAMRKQRAKKGGR